MVVASRNWVTIPYLCHSYHIVTGVPYDVFSSSSRRIISRLLFRPDRVVSGQALRLFEVIPTLAGTGPEAADRFSHFLSTCTGIM